MSLFGVSAGNTSMELTERQKRILREMEMREAKEYADRIDNNTGHDDQ